MYYRYTFVQYNKDVGLISKDLYVTLGSCLTSYTGLFAFYFWNLLDYERPAYVSTIAVGMMHPLTLYLIKILRVKCFANSDIQVLFNFITIWSGIEHYVSYLIETQAGVSKTLWLQNFSLNLQHTQYLPIFS